MPSAWLALLLVSTSALHSPTFQDSGRKELQINGSAFQKLRPEHEGSRRKAVQPAPAVVEADRDNVGRREVEAGEQEPAAAASSAAAAAAAADSAETARWWQAMAAAATDLRDIFVGLPVFEGFPTTSQLTGAATGVRHGKAQVLLQTGDFALEAQASPSEAMKLMYNTSYCVMDHSVNEIGCKADCECRWFMQCYPYYVQVKEVAGKTAYSVNVGVCELAIFVMFVVSTLTFACWVVTFLCLFRKLRDDALRS
eukprot:TRINITY_DN12374_c1_g1_i1.p1 TRINITY_DN12374_c1_g1~~TRINITY_DN12374_c1_g1_i1.p1  ORF type:complete len:254 (-),score=66.44 TRINITY_DN12374_c1_g1_i1:84-845(-)